MVCDIFGGYKIVYIHSDDDDPSNAWLTFDKLHYIGIFFSKRAIIYIRHKEGYKLDIIKSPHILSL